MVYPVAPHIASVAFYGDGMKAMTSTPNVLTITQKEFFHDTVVMDFWGGDVNSESLQSGSPVVITFGRPSGQRIFYGYVNHASRMSNALAMTSTPIDRNATTVVCAGASWWMKETGTRAWFGHTASQVVQQIADQFGLDAQITPDLRTWPSLQMAGQTYWQFCVNLARRIGYTFYCNGIQLVFKPRQTNPRKLSSLVAVYDYKHDPANLPVFSPVIGVASPGSGQLRIRHLAGVDSRQTQLIYAKVSGNPTPSVLGSSSGNPIFDETEHYAFDSQDEANGRVLGVAASNQLYLSASAYVSGNPMIAQGSLIFVQNANGSQNGLWLVKEAVHKLTSKIYSLDLQLGRDSMGATKTVSFVPMAASLPTPALVNGVWVAR